MELNRFTAAVRQGDAAGLRTLLTARPELLTAIDRPIFDTAPAIVFCRHDRPMVDVLLDFGADINARSQFWAPTIGVLDDNRHNMRAYLISRGAVPEIADFVAVAAPRRRESQVTKIILMLFGAFLTASCTNPAVSKAVGTGTDGATPIVVRTSESAVVVENHAGRALLNVRITITAADAPTPFVFVVPTIDIGATSEQPLTGFRSEDGTILDPSAVRPAQVAITARDTVAKSYEVTVPWNR